MYHLLLTRRYLTTKILPFLATLAVMMSTATVIIAWSIMTGFLGVLLNSGRTLVGDVIIAWPAAGFGYYDELITDLEKDPDIKAAAPMIEVLGVIKLPDNRIKSVIVKAVNVESFDRVTGFEKTIWWKPLDEPLPKDTEKNDPRLVSIDPFLTSLAEDAPGLRKSLEETRDAARAKGAPEKQIAELTSATERLGKLEQQGRDATRLTPNSDERRKATAAFLAEAADVLGQSHAALSALTDSKVLEFNDLYAPDENPPRHVLNRLREYERALAPVYEKYMRLYTAYENALTLTVQDPGTGERLPAMMPGIEFTNFNERFPEGYYIPKPDVGVRRPDGTVAALRSDIIGASLTLNVLPLESSLSQFDLVSRAMPVANEMRSGLYEFDKSWVLADLGTVQRMVRLGAAEEVEPQDQYATVTGPDGQQHLAPPKVIRSAPARVTQVLVRGKEKADLTKLRQKVSEIYEAFSLRHPLDVPSIRRISITTWEEEQATLVGAVKKEIVMVLLILGVVSITVSFLILAIFWAIVREKTKDIGILRAVGASRLSVCGLWLEYALITGLIGSLLGGLAGCLIVWNINPIHDWMGKHLGLVIWDPRIYYFFEIPNHVDPTRAILVMVAGTCFAVLGALIPAVRAAMMDPVKSLRFE